MNLLSLLLGSMTQSSSVDSLSGKTGISSAAVKQLLMLALPILLKSLTQNASSKEGAQSLLGALAQHKNDMPMADQLSNADAKTAVRSSIIFSVEIKRLRSRTSLPRPVFPMIRSALFSRIPLRRS